MNPQRIMKEILYGVAVGDALGFPYQFQARNERNSFPVIDMGVSIDHEGNKRNCKEDLLGLWSDDTSLSLCLAESLRKGFNLQDQAERYVSWLDEGYMSALDYAFDCGNITTVTLARVRTMLHEGKYRELTNLGNTTDVFTNGNGSLMRILPLLIYIIDKDIKEQFNIVWQASALTHPHIRAAIACMFYLKYAEYVIHGHKKIDTYHQTQKDIIELMPLINCPVEEYQVFHRILKTDIYTLEEKDILSNGYVISSLEASLWCLLNTESYSDVILKAVNLGYDTDTTAAIAGGLAALLYGYDTIPEEWLKLLVKRELINKVVKEYKE